MSDPPWSLDPEALLAHAGCVRRLARSLVLDPTRADDVEQEAWLAVLERPPAHARNLRAWLRSVVRNSARQLGRRDARRRRRERDASTSGCVPPATELVEQAEMQREVVSTVLELEEPYRSTVLLRYWRDRSPQEIARMQGVPAGTVRSRIHRAHEELRARLDRRLGDRNAWSIVLCAWIRASEGAQAAGASSAAALITGATVMKWKVELGLVVALGGAATWWVWPAAPVGPAQEGAASTTDVAISPVDAPSRPATGARASDPSSAEPSGARSPAPVAPPYPAFHGTVSAPDGSPVANAALTLFANAGDSREPEPLGSTASDETGSFLIELHAPGPESCLIRAEADGFGSVTIDPAAPGRKLELTLPWRGALAGRVRDAGTGEPLGGATIAWRRAPPATTDAAGYYRLAELPTGVPLALYARAEGFAEEPARIELSGPEETALDFVLQRGAALLVEVFDRETGAPVAGADVHGDPNVSRLTRTDAGGRCEIRILEGRELFVEVVAEGYHPFVWSYRVEELGRALSPRIPLAPLAAIEGRVTDEAGDPLAALDVHARSDGQRLGPALLAAEERAALDLPGLAGPDMLFRSSGRTDDRGVFRIQVLPGSAPKRVVAARPDGSSATSEPVVVESSQRRPWVEIVFREGADVHGRVLLDGEPREGQEVRWEPLSGGPGGSAESDRAGRYELPDVRPGAVVVRVVSDLWRYGPLPRAELVVEAGESYEQDLAWEVDVATIAGRVVSESGEPLPGVRIEAACESPEGNGTARFETSTEDDGTYAVEVRAALAYEVTAGRRSIDRSRPDVAAGSADVDFVLPELGTVTVQLVDAATGEPVQVRVESYGLSWRASGRQAFQPARVPLSHDGAAELHLPVGAVDLSVHASELGYAPATVHGVQVTKDPPRLPVVVELSRGVEVKLALVDEAGAGGASLRDHRLFLLEDAQLALLRGPFPRAGASSNYDIDGVHLWVGDPGLLDRMLQPDDRGRARLPGLAPGRYTLRAYPEDLRFEPEAFDVTGEESGPIEIRWRLR